MGWKALAGNPAIKERLAAQSRGRGLSHAYILSGPPGSGKRTLASLLSAAMVCTGPEPRPCGTCPACHKAEAGIHPDIITVEGEKGKDLTVAQIRQMRADAYIRPNEGARKVYLIQNAGTMNASAQNAMLKLLEEGPPYAAFLLLAESENELLPTVRSRCEVLRLAPVDRREGEAWLRARFPQLPAEETAAAALRCGGILGRAVAELDGGGEEERELLDLAVRLADTVESGDELGRMELTASMEKWERERMERLLSALIGELARRLECPGRSEGQRRRWMACIQGLRPLQAACGFNAAPGHLAGWLCAQLSQTPQ